MDATTLREKSYDDARTQAAIQRLLYALEKFVGFRGMTPETDEQIAKLDAAKDIALIWMASVDGSAGPLQELHRALAETPELWTRFLPPEVCIVPRNMLKTLADAVPISIDPKKPFGGPVPLGLLEDVAKSIIDQYAHAARKIREDREHREDMRLIRQLAPMYDDYRPPAK